MRNLIFLTALALLSCCNAFSQDECTVRFRISGERADGKGTWESEMEAVKKCKDLTDEEKRYQDKDWSSYYGSGYTMISSSTKKQDCAGYTFEKLFGYGPYVINASRFHDHLLVWYGTRINTGAVGWGDVRAGDVLVYGSSGHITYIKKVNTTLGVVSSVVIDTKNGEEPLFEHEIFMESDNDPLRQRFGQIYVYRLDPAKITVTKISDCDCEKKDFTGKWSTEWGTMDLKQSGSGVKGTYDWSGGKIEGNCTQSGDTLVCKGKWTQSNGKGEFKFKLLGDKFDGSYNYSTSPEYWHEDWNGMRVTQ